MVTSLVAPSLINFLKLGSFFENFQKKFYLSHEMYLHETSRTVWIFHLPALIFEIWAFTFAKMEVGHPVSSVFHGCSLYVRLWKWRNFCLYKACAAHAHAILSTNRNFFSVNSSNLVMKFSVVRSLANSQKDIANSFNLSLFIYNQNFFEISLVIWFFELWRKIQW